MARPRMLRGLMLLAILAGLLAAGVAWLLSTPPFGGRLAGERLARAQADPLYRDGRFVNPRPPAPYTLDYVGALVRGQFGGDEQREPPGPIPVLQPRPELLAAAAEGPRLRAFWLGHAGVYVEIDGLRLLFDPMFSDYASPFEVGPRRLHPVPIALAELPPIDAVLITHDHYDHLDLHTVRALAARGSRFVVPLGIGAHLEAWGVAPAQIVELQWWQEAVIGGVRLVSTPARHYSGRRGLDANATLWTSWSVLGARHRFFVSGDTGWSEHFQAIGERFGPFDLSFVKIGAYGPGAPWLDIHMSAEDAVRAHAAVRGRRMLPLHWATFNLAFHAWDEPVRRAVAAAAAQSVELLTPRVGEIVDADRPFESSAWWTAVRSP